MTVRKRRINSFKKELLKKSKEAALASVQVFNNPNISFKSEIYIVLMIIAWTYLLHAYYRDNNIDYVYYDQRGKRKFYHKTKHGARKYWELERCLNDKNSPIDPISAYNLRFLIGLRHEIEHQMTTQIDNVLSTQFQACCLNYNDYIKKLFGSEEGIDKFLSFSLQFSTISKEQTDLLEEYNSLPSNIQGYIEDFEKDLTPDEKGDLHYSYKVIFVPKLTNNPNQADTVIEFVKSDSPLAKGLNKKYAVIKETEKSKFLPGQIVKLMHEEGYTKFKVHNHTELWKSLDAKNPSKGYGAFILGKTWVWYEKWVDVVRDHCEKNSNEYQ